MSSVRSSIPVRAVLVLLAILPQSLSLLSPGGRVSSSTSATSSPLFGGCQRRSTACWLSTKEKQDIKDKLLLRNGTPVLNGKMPPKINGSDRNGNEIETHNMPDLIKALNATDIESEEVINMTKTAEDMSQLMIEGSKEMIGNITERMEETFIQYPEEVRTAIVNSWIEFIEEQLEPQITDIEATIVRPLEQFAFSDAPLYEGIQKTKTRDETRELMRERLILTGINSTLSASRRLRTGQILRNLNVAPFYYSVALMMRWIRKLGYPPMLVLTLFQKLGSIFKTPNLKRRKNKGKEAYDEYMESAELMQAGWKRTGEIAAKGNMQKKIAIMRRSAEIWAYFSSFYLKERRFNKMFESGKWSAAQLSEERSNHGAEITQNLLKLGPTFIKVCCLCVINSLLLAFLTNCSSLDKSFRLVSILFRKNTLSS